MAALVKPDLSKTNSHLNWTAPRHTNIEQPINLAKLKVTGSAQSPQSASLSILLLARNLETRLKIAPAPSQIVERTARFPQF